MNKERAFCPSELNFALGNLELKNLKRENEFMINRCIFRSLPGISSFAAITVMQGILRDENKNRCLGRLLGLRDRKSTRLNSSHSQISYAVFCLKKKRTYASSSSSSE